MITLLIIVSVIAVLSLATALFFGVEYKKKFEMMYDFVRKNPEQLLYFWYPGAKKACNIPGMRSFLITWDRPFSVLIGFELKVPYLGTGFDYYGMVHAQQRKDGVYYANFATYLGNGPCQFMFYLDSRPEDGHSPEVITSYQMEHRTRFLSFFRFEGMNVEPMAVYPPHWYQKIGFFG